MTPSQRQHIRVHLPVSVIIRGKHCPVIDWSHHGMAFDSTPLKTAHIMLKHNDIFDATLELDFKNFGMTVPLQCEVRHVNADGSRAGVRFHRIDEQTVSLLQYLVKTHISGKLVHVGHVLSVAEKGHDAAPRTDSLNNEISTALPKRIISEWLYIVIILGLLGFILLRLAA